MKLLHGSLKQARLLVAALLLICTLNLLPGLSRPQPSARTFNKLAGQPVTDYRARRERLMEKIKDGVVLLIGTREEDLGEVDRFRQKNNFMYLTGVETPAAALLLIPKGLIANKDATEILFIPARNERRERWTGFQIGPGPDAEERFGIKTANASQFRDQIRSLLSQTPFKAVEGSSQAKLYTVVPTGSRAPLTRESQFVESIRQMAPHVKIVDVTPHIADMRLVKSPAEIELLQRAIDITGEAHREAVQAIKPGAFEYQVQGALEYAFTRNGAEHPGFPSIVGSGIYSTILHYNENRKRIEAGDLIVIDIGAEFSYYTADITRTYPATGKFTPRQRSIYELVLKAQRAAEQAFKPGESTIGDLQRLATEVMKASPLRDSKGNTLERYFIHGLGHWLGMEVHDVGNYNRPIPEGSVFTIEPGIYIPDEKLGVRIEDDYLATNKGLVKMSSKIPSDPDEIERWMSGSRSSVTPSQK